MILRDEFEKYLSVLYSVDSFEDYCLNGLVVEGKSEINRIAFGVSFNSLFIDKSVSLGCDAVVVHHGIFDKGPFSIRGYLKGRLKEVFKKNISLFSLHLPMDAHPEIGHNALLFQAIGAGIESPFKWGFIGRNSSGYSLREMCKNFENYLIPSELKNGFSVIRYPEAEDKKEQDFAGFGVLNNGPEIPNRILIASGGSTDLFEESILRGVDTFICGEIKEQIPAISLETKTNFVNLGHYFSERPGILALKEKVEKELPVECEFIEVVNPI